jgi:hypothetical protein
MSETIGGIIRGREEFNKLLEGVDPNLQAVIRDFVTGPNRNKRFDTPEEINNRLGEIADDTEAQKDALADFNSFLMDPNDEFRKKLSNEYTEADADAVAKFIWNLQRLSSLISEKPEKTTARDRFLADLSEEDKLMLMEEERMRAEAEAQAKDPRGAKKEGSDLDSRRMEIYGPDWIRSQGDKNYNKMLEMHGLKELLGEPEYKRRVTETLVLLATEANPEMARNLHEFLVKQGIKVPDNAHQLMSGFAAAQRSSQVLDKALSAEVKGELAGSAPSGYEIAALLESGYFESRFMFKNGKEEVLDVGVGPIANFIMGNIGERRVLSDKLPEMIKQDIKRYYPDLGEILNDREVMRTADADNSWYGLPTQLREKYSSPKETEQIKVVVVPRDKVIINGRLVVIPEVKDRFGQVIPGDRIRFNENGSQLLIMSEDGKKTEDRRTIEVNESGIKLIRKDRKTNEEKVQFVPLEYNPNGNKPLNRGRITSAYEIHDASGAVIPTERIDDQGKVILIKNADGNVIETRYVVKEANNVKIVDAKGNVIEQFPLFRGMINEWRINVLDRPLGPQRDRKLPKYNLWISDQEYTLANGTKIPSGKPIIFGRLNNDEKKRAFTEDGSFRLMVDYDPLEPENLTVANAPLQAMEKLRRNCDKVTWKKMIEARKDPSTPGLKSLREQQIYYLSEDISLTDKVKFKKGSLFIKDDAGKLVLGDRKGIKIDDDRVLNLISSKLVGAQQLRRMIPGEQVLTLNNRMRKQSGSALYLKHVLFQLGIEDPSEIVAIEPVHKMWTFNRKGLAPYGLQSDLSPADVNVDKKEGELGYEISRLPEGKRGDYIFSEVFAARCAGLYNLTLDLINTLYLTAQLDPGLQADEISEAVIKSMLGEQYQNKYGIGAVELRQLVKSLYTDILSRTLGELPAFQAMKGDPVRVLNFLDPEEVKGLSKEEMLLKSIKLDEIEVERNWQTAFMKNYYAPHKMPRSYDLVHYAANEIYRPIEGKGDVNYDRAVKLANKHVAWNVLMINKEWTSGVEVMGSRQRMLAMRKIAPEFRRKMATADFRDYLESMGENVEDWDENEAKGALGLQLSGSIHKLEHIDIGSKRKTEKAAKYLEASENHFSKLVTLGVSLVQSLEQEFMDQIGVDKLIPREYDDVQLQTVQTFLRAGIRALLKENIQFGKVAGDWYKEIMNNMIEAAASQSWMQGKSARNAVKDLIKQSVRIADSSMELAAWEISRTKDSNGKELNEYNVGTDKEMKETEADLYAPGEKVSRLYLGDPFDPENVKIGLVFRQGGFRTVMPSDTKVYITDDSGEPMNRLRGTTRNGKFIPDPRRRSQLENLFNHHQVAIMAKAELISKALVMALNDKTLLTKWDGLNVDLSHVTSEDVIKYVEQELNVTLRQ